MSDLSIPQEPHPVWLAWMQLSSWRTAQHTISPIQTAFHVTTAPVAAPPSNTSVASSSSPSAARSNLP